MGQQPPKTALTSEGISIVINVDNAAVADEDTMSDLIVDFPPLQGHNF